MSERTPRSAPVDVPSPAERIWQFAMLLSIGSLFAIYGLLRLFAVDDAGSLGNLVLLAVQTGPLLAFVPALLAGSARAAALLSFLSILYFCSGVLTIVDPAARLAGGAEVFFSITLFVSTTYYARQRGLRARAQEEASAAASAAASEGPSAAPPPPEDV